MHETAQRIIHTLAEAFHAQGKELYLVGGTVRDALLGRESHDIDMATDARPDEIKEIAASTNPLHIIPIGEKFGTIQLRYAAESTQEPVIIEITTYRGERYTPGSRHPEVQFGTSLLEDLRRRDFTINAIAKDAWSGELVDPFAGLLALHNRVIAAVEDPAQRFADDPLRLLRAIRFAVQLEFFLDEATGQSIKAEAGRILSISQERIRDELQKILVLDRVVPGLYLLETFSLLVHILPEVQALIGVDQSPHHRDDVFGHTMRVVNQTPPRLTVRLAALLHDIAKPQTRSVDARGTAHFYGHEDLGAEMARTILRRLRFGNDLVEHVATAVQLHMRVNAYRERWSIGAVRRLYLDAGACMEDLLDLALADGTSSDRTGLVEHVPSRLAHLRQRLTQVEGDAHTHPLMCPLDGDDLMTLFGRGPGPWLRPLKAHLHDLVIEGVLHSDDLDGAIAAAKVFMEKQEKG